MALAALRALSDSLSAEDPDFRAEILPSLGSNGGMAALRAGAIDMAVAGRVLTAQEKSQGLAEAVCVKTAMVFASSRPQPTGISRADLPRLYSDPRPNWPDGTPLKIVMRSRSGTELGFLSAAVPGLATAFERALARPETPVGATDQENADLAQKVAGSFAISTLLQIRAENLKLQVLSLDGIEPAPQTLLDKTYPLPLVVCVVRSASPSPAAAKFEAHLNSPKGQELWRAFGTVPLD